MRPDLPILATAALGTGVYFFARSLRDFRLRRLIENTPTARIRSMAMGLAEINGVTETNHPIIAPFSGRSCAYWEVDIATRGGRNKSWQVVHRNASGHPFYVRDETGIALVYPKGAECKVRFGVEEECVGLVLPECYSTYMSEQHLGLRHFWGLGAMRFRERMIEEGDRVYVLGTAMPRPQVVTVSDDEVLQATGTDGMMVQRQQTLNEETSAIIRQGENEPTFIISQGSERELTGTLQLRGLAELIAGPALTLLGLGWWLYAISGGKAFK